MKYHVTIFKQTSDSNLAQADVIIKFVDKKLEELGSPLALKLLERLRLRYSDRKNAQRISLVKFYEDPESLAASQDDTDTYRMSSKATIIKLSKAIHQRLQFHQGGTDTIRD